ncbi:hypothetical protein V865_001233 [Kwoniella europaea PYCC6329]|uniref:Uncharacterized protein n=1 Tax=Kwoniella europaea PYCC6329 TaxID=1423913 RepID=A0AAX4K9I1_9TREE
MSTLTSTDSRKKRPDSQFTSRIQPPSTLPLRTSSKPRQSITTSKSASQFPDRAIPAEKPSFTSRSPPPRVSFLTPREVWSPLATPIPNMNERPNVKVATAPSRVPKYQLKDTGPIPLTSPNSTPKPQIRPRPILRPSMKPRRQTSMQRPVLQIPKPHVRPLTTTQQISRLPIPTHSRPVSLPADPVITIPIPKPRPASYQSPYSDSSSSYISQPTITIPEPRPSLLPVSGIPTSVQPFRQTSNQSAASSTCSSASSLARHRAIKKKGQDRSSFARLSTYSPPNHVALIKALAVDSEAENEDTESTISDHSIRTVATVNPPDREPTIHESEASYNLEPKSKSTSLSSTHTLNNYSSSFPPEGLTAPYLVPSTAPPMTLEWESDESSGEIDEAEKVWRELELKLGRKVRGRSLRRGKWVVKPRNEGERGSNPQQQSSFDDLDHADNGEAIQMETTSSGFSVSLYYPSASAHPHSTPPLHIPQPQSSSSSFAYGSSPMMGSPSSATALFDMSAPLVPGGSKHGYTPWNTPLMNKESIKRGNRVKKRYASCDVGESDAHHTDRLGSLEEYSRVEFPQMDDYSPGSSSINSIHNELNSLPAMSNSIFTPESISTNGSTTPQPRPDPITVPKPNSIPAQPPKTMYRLDSHVVSALTALQGTFDSPDLDFALQTCSSPASSPIVASSEEEAESGGLGLGMKLNLKTVYHLPTLSPAVGKRSTEVEISDRHNKGGRGVNEQLDNIASARDRIPLVENDHTTKLDKTILRIEPAPSISDNPDEEDGVLVIRDLDTGLERQVRVGDGLTLS